MHTFKKILVLAPHTDDGELGAGASINKWISMGSEVYYYAFSAAEESVPEGFPKDTLRTEVLNATFELGIKRENVKVGNYPVRKLSNYRQEILEDLVSFRKIFDPDLVLLPSPNDIHQDHQVISNEGIRAFKNKTILAYELPWNNRIFENVCFSEVSPENIMRKYEALKCYKTQMHRSYLNEEFLKGWAKLRGTQVNLEFAECFEVIRWMI